MKRAAVVTMEYVIIHSFLPNSIIVDRIMLKLIGESIKSVNQDNEELKLSR